MPKGKLMIPYHVTSYGEGEHLLRRVRTRGRLQENIEDLDGNPTIEYSLSFSAKTDITETQIFNIKSEVKKWLTKKVNVFAFYKHEYYNEQEDFQFKVGLGVKL